MLLRKEFPGSDSFGNSWNKPGDVVEVDDEQGRHLLKIKDAGFTEVAEFPVTKREDVELISESPKVIKPLKLKNPVSKGIDVSTFTE